MIDLFYILLSQWVPEYPVRHLQRYPVDPLTSHDPLFKHGEDEQVVILMAEKMTNVHK